MASLTWLGHAAFMIESDNGKKIYIDPFLNGNPVTPEALKQPERVDVIALTHGHGDHVGDTVALSKAFPDSEIFCIYELKSWLERQGANVGQIPGLNKGGSQEIEGIRFSLVNAFHTSTSDAGEYLGEAAGIMIKLENGRTIYFAGDTCVFGDMQLIRQLHRPDYVVLPIGDWFTMGPQEAALALELLGNVTCIPSHYGTFPVLTGTPEALLQAKPDANLHVLQPGETLELA